MAYGTKTSNIMDIPLSVASVTASWLGDNGYSFEGMHSVRVLSVADGTLGNYDEGSALNAFGSIQLVVPDEQILVLDYNKSMLLRIQRTQIQDIPVSSFSKKVALQQAKEVFVPAHDIYTLAKIYAARPVGNIVALDTNDYPTSFYKVVSKILSQGASASNVIAWVTYTFSDTLRGKINFTGSDQGYSEGKAGFLGRFSGVPVIAVPDTYMYAGVSAIVVDKRAVVNVTPKMDPKNGGMTVIDPVPAFSGIEIQLRDRADTFVLNKKARNVATLELLASTTTTTTTTSTTTTTTTTTE